MNSSMNANAQHLALNFRDENNCLNNFLTQSTALFSDDRRRLENENFTLALLPQL